MIFVWGGEAKALSVEVLEMVSFRALAPITLLIGFAKPMFALLPVSNLQGVAKLGLSTPFQRARNASHPAQAPQSAKPA